jgi:hypothetical protein
VLTPVEIEDRFDNLDRRLDRIEQILPTLATNEALRQTNETLRQYATKEDLLRALENYPTRADLIEVVGQAFERAEANARILHEDVVEKIRLLGENRRRRR